MTLAGASVLDPPRPLAGAGAETVVGQEVVGARIATPWAPEQRWQINQGYGATDEPVEPPARGAKHWHAGADLDLPSNSLVVFPAGMQGVIHHGVIQRKGKAYSQANDGGGYGPHVVTVTVNDAYDVILGHGVQEMAKEGPVRSGQPILKTDSMGNSTGPHLHFEVRPKGGDYGTDMDPSQLLTLATLGVGGAALVTEPAVSVNSSVGTRPHLDTPDPGRHTSSGLVTPVRHAVGGRGVGAATPNPQPGPAPGPPAAGQQAQQDVCGFAAGNCTAFMAAVFPCICGKGGFHDGATWYAAAQALGWPTSSTPNKGWIGVWDRSLSGSGGHGHVGEVIDFNASTRQLTLYSMNVHGVGQVSTDTWGMANFTGCFQPPCNVTGVPGQAAVPAGPCGPAPDMLADPGAWAQYQLCSATQPLVGELQAAEKTALNFATGVAQASLGFLMLGGATLLLVAALKRQSPTRMAQGAVRAASRSRRRQAPRPPQHPEARVARARGGRAEPAPPSGVRARVEDTRQRVNARRVGVSTEGWGRKPSMRRKTTPEAFYSPEFRAGERAKLNAALARSKRGNTPPPF
jgi:surface antigen